MKYLSLFLLTLFVVSCNKEKNTNTEDTQEFQTQKVEVITQYEDLQAIINRKDDKLYVINFWATWCKPCIEELPGFMEVNETYKNKGNYEMILVSLDRAADFETKMKPFLASHNITTSVYLLDDNKRMNEWIPSFDPHWTGAIPATSFYKNGQKLDFKEASLNKKELEQLIKKYL